jgi:predicted PurR-regulated permease PerM
MASPPPSPASSAGRNALLVTAAVAVGAALFFLRPILTPFALALFLMVIIDGLSRVLRRRLPGLTERGALAVAILVTVAGFGVTVMLIAGNAPSFISQLVADTPRLNAIIHDVAHRLHMHNPPSVQRMARQLDPAKYAGGLAQTLQGLVSTFLFILIYLGFLFASRASFRKKAVRLFPSPEGRENAAAAFERIRNGIERYLWVQTVTGLMIAVASAVILLVVGMPNAVFWGFLILVTSYVPIIGGMIGQFLPPLFALVEFNNYWQPGAILVGLTVVQLVVGSIIFPRMQGRSLNLDPVVILLSLSFWGLVWGVPGMFLSTPLTVTVMVVADQFPSTRWMAILLSSDGDPFGEAQATADPSQPAPEPAEASAGEPPSRMAQIGAPFSRPAP